MSWLLFIVLALCIAAIFSQFGGKLRASSALGWWLIAAFLLVAAAFPSALVPLTHWLGVTLVSNFVMAATILFLFLQVFQLTATQTSETRKLRATVSKTAAETYLKTNQRAVETASRRPSALIVLPCFNEEESVPRLVPKLEELKRNARWGIEYCFVDDGSTDSTREVLGRLAPQGHVQHLVNNGVSGVLMTGFHIALTAGFDYAIQCDGDGQHPIEAIEGLLDEADRKKADLLIASRFAMGSDISSTTAARRAGSLLLIAVLKILWPGLRCSDPTSGFRVYSQKACRHLIPRMPDEFPEPEAIALAKIAGLTVVETPVTMEKRTTGLSSLSGFKSFVYMYKAISALIGLRLRSLKR